MSSKKFKIRMNALQQDVTEAIRTKVAGRVLELTNPVIFINNGDIENNEYVFLIKSNLYTGILQNYDVKDGESIDKYPFHIQINILEQLELGNFDVVL